MIFKEDEDHKDEKTKEWDSNNNNNKANNKFKWTFKLINNKIIMKMAWDKL